MSDFDPLSPDSYRFWANESVRYADLDMLGHVNNKGFVTYFETGRIAYFFARGLKDGPKAGMAMVRLEIDYRQEIVFPGTLRVGVRLHKLGRSSMTLACAIFGEDGACRATSMATVVRFDPVARKSVPFTEIERERLEADL